MICYCLVDYIAQAGMEKVILKNDLYTLEARAKEWNLLLKSELALIIETQV